MSRYLLGSLVALSLLGSVQAASFPSLYWSETGGIVRSQLDGTQVETVTPGFEIGGLGLDRASDQLFFSDILPLGGPGPAGFIFRGTSDGRDVESIVDQLPAPTALALDRTEGRVIWSDREARTISIARYDGSGEKTILPLHDWIADINGLAFDPWKRQLYFSYVNPLIDSLTPGSIARMNLDGGELETVISGLVAPQGVAVDHVRGRVYWADQLFAEQGLINSARFDGSEREKNVTDLIAPRGVAFDPYANQLYWTDHATGKIQTQTPFVPVVDLVTDRPAPVAIGMLFHSGVAGDTNDDGQVDLADLNNVRNHFGEKGTNVVGDANLDGHVDLDDVNDVRNYFGQRFVPPDETAGVPEPSSLLLGIAGLSGGAALVRRARKSPTPVRR